MKLKHLEHVEDLVLLDDNGLDICKKYLTSALNTLYGIKSCDIQGKIDGSPSFVYGKHPTENTKIISTKSFFNKTPKYYSSISEIQECIHEDLRNKLDNNEVTKEELISESLNLANKYQNTYNSFVTILNCYIVQPRLDLEHL